MALTNLLGSIGHEIKITATDGNKSLVDDMADITNKRETSFTFGSGNGQINKPYSAIFNIASASTQTLDLDAATLKDWFGNTLNFAAIKGIRITHLKTSLSSDIDVGGDFMTTIFGASFLYPLEKSAIWSHSTAEAGLLIVAGTGDVIELINNDGSNIADVEIVLFGN